ncbi:FIST signal transduction protein [Desulfonatronovibrio magnus]|uniref:FIST signal transduction protein n=1 Tax=Desulfonatronovibrio magnus TaxID=698827 RepID=UPI0005EB206D|nr:FIST N-terminal domain-containing protein [Desulfonatronovibrio magnus]
MKDEIVGRGSVGETTQRLVGVGWSSAVDAGQAGTEAGSAALSTLGSSRKPGWALAFCGGRHDPETFLAALRQELGDIPVAGGSAAGCITNASLGYTGFECAVAVFGTDLARPRFILETGLDDKMKEVGTRLGRRLAREATPGAVTLLFLDALRFAGPPPQPHVVSLLLDGMHAALESTAPVLIGAGTITDHQFRGGYIFDGNGVCRHAALAIVLPPGISACTDLSHGCAPISGFHEITRAEGIVIHELDGRPTLEVLGSLGLKPALLPLHVGLSRKIGDPYGPDMESVFVNRLILSVDPETRSVSLFEADLKRGDWVQVMARGNADMLAATHDATDRLIQKADTVRPFFALYVDCAGRAASFCGSEAEEAAIVQATLGDSVPLLGCYTGVQIASITGRGQSLNRAGVLTLLSAHENPHPRR